MYAGSGRGKDTDSEIKMKKMIDDLRRLVRFASVSERTESKETPFGRETAAVLDEALTICRNYGLRTKNCENMTGYAEIGQGEDLIGILVHLDVVPAGEGWISPPFEPVSYTHLDVYKRQVRDML